MSTSLWAAVASPACLPVFVGLIAAPPGLIWPTSGNPARTTIQRPLDRDAGQTSRLRSVAVVVLLDVTRGSWPRADLAELRRAVQRSIADNLQSTDQAVVGSIAQEVRLRAVDLIVSPIPDSWVQVLDIPWSDRFGNSRIWDSCMEAIDVLSGPSNEPNRLIVLITAGRAAGNFATVLDVVGRAQDVSVTISVIFRPTYRYAWPFEQHGSSEAIWVRPEAALRMLAGRTKGRFVTSSAVDEQSLSQLLGDQIRGQRDWTSPR